jgi:hypothetical protein
MKTTTTVVIAATTKTKVAATKGANVFRDEGTGFIEIEVGDIRNRRPR